MERVVVIRSAAEFRRYRLTRSIAQLPPPEIVDLRPYFDASAPRPNLTAFCRHHIKQCRLEAWEAWRDNETERLLRLSHIRGYTSKPAQIRRIICVLVFEDLVTSSTQRLDPAILEDVRKLPTRPKARFISMVQTNMGVDALSRRWQEAKRLQTLALQRGFTKTKNARMAHKAITRLLARAVRVRYGN